VSFNGYIKIEKGVPVPEGLGRRKTKYPWADMEVGDSFWAPGARENVLQTLFKRQAPRKFVYAAERHDDVEGVRVWRVG
jgi:hypothetical protein